MPVFQSAASQVSGISLNSWEFLLIAAIAVIVSGLTKQVAARNVALLAFNLYFLLAFTRDIASLLVLAAFLATCYFVGLWRKGLARNFTMAMQFGVIASLWLFLFLARDSTLMAPINPFRLAPVSIIGISYIVFRCISYMMEVEFIEKPSFSRFCVYVLFFPVLLAGPIERYRAFEQQLAAPVYESAMVLAALHRIANGFIKKFVIADNLSVFGIFSFENAADMSFPMLWIGALSQLGLIYLDFSGYCDIAIGVAALMGFRLVENFNRPFLSTNIQEFWNRWHISLSTLVRDYIFTPINMTIIKGTPRHVQFLLITMVYFFSMILIGLWHGVSWGFVAFGAVHGGALVGSQLIKKYYKKKPQSHVVLDKAKRFAVYSFVSVTLILWLKTYDEWGRIYGKMLGVVQ